MSGSGNITLHHVYPSGSESATMITIREKNKNDSISVTALGSPIEVTGVQGREYEIAVTRAPESGDPNQEFQISTVVLIGSECLFVGGIFKYYNNAHVFGACVI